MSLIENPTDRIIGNVDAAIAALDATDKQIEDQRQFLLYLSEQHTGLQASTPLQRSVAIVIANENVIPVQQSN